VSLILALALRKPKQTMTLAQEQIERVENAHLAVIQGPLIEPRIFLNSNPINRGEHIYNPWRILTQGKNPKLPIRWRGTFPELRVAFELFPCVRVDPNVAVF
jgi:hypothetical protein